MIRTRSIYSHILVKGTYSSVWKYVGYLFRASILNSAISIKFGILFINCMMSQQSKNLLFRIGKGLRVVYYDKWAILLENQNQNWIQINWNAAVSIDPEPLSIAHEAGSIIGSVFSLSLRGFRLYIPSFKIDNWKSKIFFHLRL